VLNRAAVQVTSVAKGFIGVCCLEKLPLVFQEPTIIDNTSLNLPVLQLPAFLGAIESLVQ
jgi:hypothetical protein